jgi:hypothetical protein
MVLLWRESGKRDVRSFAMELACVDDVKNAMKSPFVEQPISPAAQCRRCVFEAGRPAPSYSAAHGNDQSRAFDLGISAFSRDHAQAPYALGHMV